jgi:hypothetical protein
MGAGKPMKMLNPGAEGSFLRSKTTLASEKLTDWLKCLLITLQLLL